MKPLRVLLADDHKLFRAGIRSLLSELRYIEIVAEAADGDEAIALAREHRPDIVLMDISMKGLSGLEAAARIHTEMPSVRVIMLSMHDGDEHVAQALHAGACGYLLKDSAEPELEFALNAVARGDTYLSPPASTHVIDAYLRRVAAEPSPLSLLTPRQREILQLIAEGHGTKDIARRLVVSVKTVEAHRAQIMRRIAIRDVPGLVRFAIRNGLVSPGE